MSLSRHRAGWVALSLVQALGCSATPAPATPAAEPQLHDDRNVVRKEAPRPCSAASPLACEARCNEGEGASCSSLGDLYLEGKGLRKDVTRATQLFVAACEHGDIYGCAQGGRLVEDADAARGVGMYRRACDAGYEASCNDLGYTAERGIGQPKNEILAYESYVRSCRLGGAYGCYNTGVFSENGRGGAPKDYAVSAGIYQRTCSAGFDFGCGSLGRLYYLGRGVLKDEPRGVKLLEESCRSGYKYACDFLTKHGHDAPAGAAPAPRSAQ